MEKWITEGGASVTDRLDVCFFLFFLPGLGLGLAANELKEDNPVTVRARVIYRSEGREPGDASQEQHIPALGSISAWLCSTHLFIMVVNWLSLTASGIN